MSKLTKKKSSGIKPIKANKKGKIQKRKKANKQKAKPDKNAIGGKGSKSQNGQKKNKVAEMSIEDLENADIKSKPSKSELKSVLEGLKNNSSLILVKKALKYIPHYLKSEGLTKKLLKELIRLWAEAGEKVRVICLLCLIRIYTKLKNDELKQLVLKKLYTGFLEKCRITKRETMSMIGFMRHSLIELYKLDPTNAFKQAQTCCQQMTVTLKNAKTHKNEETYKTVLNWQYANCLILLSSLVISHNDNTQIKTLTQEVIKLNLGAIELLTSPRYYPFYCHLIENLIGLSESSGLFIPILPYIMGIIDKIQLPKEDKPSKKAAKESESDKQHQKKKKKNNTKGSEHDSDMEIDDEEEDDNDAEMDDDESEPKKREYNMDLLNHVSLNEAHSLEYNLAVLDKVYELLLRYLASQCHRIAFPELTLLPGVALKKWLRKQPMKYVEKYKVLLDKVKSDCNTLDEARKSISFAFTDYAGVDAWEKRIRDSRKLSLPKLLATVVNKSVDNNVKHQI